MDEEALLKAIKTDNAGRVREIIEGGLPVDVTMFAGILAGPPNGPYWSWHCRVTPLDYAVNHQRQESLKVLLGLGAAPDQPESEFPALLSAALCDRADLVELLVAAGSNPNRPTENGVVPLMAAATWACSQAWLALRSCRASLHHTDKDGRTVLFYACRNARPPFDATNIIQECLAEGIDVNVADNNGLTALHVAAEAGPSATGLLLRAGADPMAIDNNGRSFLIHSSRCSYHDSLELVLSTDPDLAHADNAGRTALHYAVLQPSNRPAEHLLDAGAEADRKDNRGRTSLMHLVRQTNFNDRPAYITEEQFVQRVRLLMLNNAGTDARDIHGNNVWHHLAKEWCLSYYEDFREFLKWELRWDGDHALCEAHSPFHREGDDDSTVFPKLSSISLLCAQALLEQSTGDYGISDQNTSGNTPLMVSAEATFFWLEEVLSLLKLVLSRRVDVMAINKDGDTALTLLCTRWAGNFEPEHENRAEAAEALCTQGIDVNAKNFSGKTALMLANENNLHKVVAVLRRYGARVALPPDAAADIEGRAPTVDVPDEFNDELQDDEDNAWSREPELSCLDWPRLVDEAGEQDSNPRGASDTMLDEDGKAASLHGEARVLYRRANELYKESGGTLPYIRLTSGRRTVARQVQLYRSYVHYKKCRGKFARPANRPGKSLHNFGMAIDVVQGVDDALIKSALMSSGWVASVEGESWHFEAQRANSFGTIANYIRQTMEPLSSEMASKIGNAVTLQCQLEGGERGFLDLQNKYKDAYTKTQDTRHRLREARSELNKQARALNDEADAIREEDNEVRRLRSRLNGMIYDRCPNRERFEDCTHESLKQQWLRERQSLSSELREREANLGNRRAIWQREKRNWGEADRDLRLQERDLRKEEVELRKLKIAYDKARAGRAHLERELRRGDTDIVRLTARIQSLVDAV